MHDITCTCDTACNLSDMSVLPHAIVIVDVNKRHRSGHGEDEVLLPIHWDVGSSPFHLQVLGTRTIHVPGKTFHFLFKGEDLLACLLLKYTASLCKYTSLCKYIASIYKYLQHLYVNIQHLFFPRVPRVLQRSARYPIMVT